MATGPYMELTERLELIYSRSTAERVHLQHLVSIIMEDRVGIEPTQDRD